MDKRIQSARSLPGAGIAQLVEHVICNLGVAGSNPAAGTISPEIRFTALTLAGDIRQGKTLRKCLYAGAYLLNSP
jgi:hypothetical protein